MRRSVPFSALLLIALGLAAGCAAPPIERPNVVLITLDTTRVDHLGCYGYERNTTPNLDALAAESVLYTRAMSTSSWTLPSHASLFTGKFTSSHGARYDPEGPLRLLDAIEGRPGWEQYRARGLATDEATLAATLASAGYATGATVGGPWLKKVFGLDEGFEYYDDSGIGTVDGRQADGVTDGAIEWIDSVGDRPFFLFLNYFDPHGPYTAPDEFKRRFVPAGDLLKGKRKQLARIKAGYDAEIAFMDHHIGTLIRRLKEQGIYDSTWIIVTADHGELLGEHNSMGHGTSLYQEELHVPLFMKYPVGEETPRSVDDLIQLVDIFPLICERLGIEVPPTVQGDAPPAIGHPIVAEVYPLPAMSRRGDWQALFEGNFKFLWNSRGRHELFDLRQDPREQTNLLTVETARRDGMSGRLLSYLEELPEPGRAPSPDELDPETREALESLGYVK